MTERTRKYAEWTWVDGSKKKKKKAGKMWGGGIGCIQKPLKVRWEIKFVPQANFDFVHSLKVFLIILKYEK